MHFWTISPNYIKIENVKKNNSNNINNIFEINKINDIYFEKTKKVNSNTFNQNLSIETAESSVIMIQYYLKNSKNINKYNLQLIAMVSVFICSKIFDIKRFTLAHLHQISEYKYNNKMVLKCEFDILKTLNYEL